MLSVSGAMDAGAAGGYFAKEEYSLRGPETSTERIGKEAANS